MDATAWHSYFNFSAQQHRNMCGRQSNWLKFDPRQVVLRLYCAHGRDENFIKVMKNDLACDRTSSPCFLANHLRLFFAAASPSPQVISSLHRAATGGSVLRAFQRLRRFSRLRQAARSAGGAHLGWMVRRWMIIWQYAGAAFAS